LEIMEERVQKIIANAGICARRRAEDLIKSGKVTVNGKKITIGDKADVSKDDIVVDGKKLKRIRRVYLAFHKPKGCLTSLKDPSGKRTIFDIIKVKERVIPVGRLDFNTEGLLILTNDGNFANKIMHPRYEVRKIYHVSLDKPFDEDLAKKFKHGIRLEDGVTRPSIVKALSNDKRTVSITIHEGKNRIVRRMFNSLGYNVRRLVRVKVGPIGLNDLPAGKTRPLTTDEIMSLVKR
jgi:23S rRNA pseudouridine2605 synthase